MKLKFWGAARTVTGSMHLLEIENGVRVLLDCGIYQGSEGFREEYNRSFPCDPGDIDYVILSHAHIDHCGNLPQLVKAGFKGKIFCTHATYDLVTILLEDSARIQERDAEYENKYRQKRGLPEIEPLYLPADVPKALEHFVTLSYDTWFNITPDIELFFRDAGHMLGSASVTLHIHEAGKIKRIGFTGDIGREEREILRDPAPMPEVDILISESTYGGKDHESITDAGESLLKIIEETCIQKQGKLFIPAFSVGRTQDIVHILDKLENEGRMPHIPVYVDSPLAINATAIFEMHPECYNEDLREYIRTDPNPFGFNSLHYTRSVEASKQINNMEGPAVIISASGMITAGRILHHLANGIENPANTILIVGYCAQGTLGQQLVQGAQKIKIFGTSYQVKATVKKLNAFSAHAGQTEMYNFIALSQPREKLKQLFLVHGETERAIHFQNFLVDKGYKDVIIPHRGEVFEY